MWGPHDWSLQINNNIEHQAVYSASALKKKQQQSLHKQQRFIFPDNELARFTLKLSKKVHSC